MYSLDSTDPLLSALPAPILLSIVKLSPDLCSLHSLDRASPTVAALFDECAVEIVEAVTSSTVPDATQRLIRAVTMIRSNSISSCSLDHFKADYSHKGYLYEERPNAPRQVSTSDCDLCNNTPRVAIIPQHTTVSVLRGILRSAFHIRHHTDACIQHMLNICIYLKPSHLLDPNYRYKHRTGRLGTLRCPQRRPLGQRYELPNLNRPSWIEQQRIHLALWRLQLFFDLKTAAEKNLLAWTKEDVHRVKVHTLETFWDLGLVQERISDQLEHIISALDYLRESSQLFTPPLVLDTLSTLPVVKDKLWTPWPAQAPGFSWLHEYRAPGYTFYHLARCGSSSPLRLCEDGAVFRRVGLFLWDSERLRHMEFLDPSKQAENPGPYLSKFNIWFTWESILPEEVVVEADVRRINEFPEESRAFGSTKLEVYHWPVPYYYSRDNEGND